MKATRSSAALLILLVGSMGCRVHRKPFNNYHRGDQVQTYIDPSRCHDINDLDYVCDGVTFHRVLRPAK